MVRISWDDAFHLPLPANDALPHEGEAVHFSKEEEDDDFLSGLLTLY